MSSFLQYLLVEQETSFLLQPFYYTTISAIIFIFILFFLLLKWPSSLNSTEKLILPPSPRKLPIIGNLHQLGFQPHRSLAALAKRFGPLMLLHLGKRPVLVVSSADAASEVLKSHDLMFANRPKSIIFEKLFCNYKDVVMAPYGEHWRQMKRICVLHLLSKKRVQSFSIIREEETALMIDKFKEFSKSCLPINLSEAFFTLTNNVLCRVAFGRKYCSSGYGELDGNNYKFKELLAKFMELMGVFNVGDYIPWLSWVSRFNGLDAQLDKVTKELCEFIDGIIEEHEDRQVAARDIMTSVEGDHEDVKDFVDVLLLIQRENSDGFPIDRVSINAVMLDMFVAGSDTIYSFLEWVMSELIRHPKVMNQAQNEVREILNNKSDITEEDFDKMHYLKAIIKETFRLHPPAPLLPRESTQDIKIKGYDIATGTQMLVNIWKIGRDPVSWDRADEFWPERFLDTSNIVSYDGHDFQLIPFGAGRRSCPGLQFAKAAYELVLVNLLYNFDWRHDQDLDMTESIGISKHRKFPLIAITTTPSGE